MSTWPSARRKKGQEMLVGRGMIGERLEDSKAEESQTNGHGDGRMGLRAMVPVGLGLVGPWEG